MIVPVYRFRATQASGFVHKGQLAAANENDLMLMLRESGLELIDAKAQETARFPVLAQRQRGTARQMIMVCQQLKDLLRAGLPFLEALKGITGTLQPGPLRDKLEAIARSVSHGSTVAAAFGEHRGSFNPIFLALLKTGESSGNLASTFEQLTTYLARQARFHDQLHRALRYPIFLMCLALGVTVFMLTIVVPRVLDFLNTIAIDLPWPTRVLITLSSLFAEGWWIGLLALAAGTTSFMLARRASKDFALRSDRWLLALPGLGTVLHKLAIARFAHSFSLLLQSGADLPTALATAKGVLGNRALNEAAKTAEQAVQAGQPLSTATLALFPPFVTQMLRVGEQSGSLPSTLNNVSTAYDSEAQAAVDQFIGALEPALTLLVGALLAWVVLAVLGPVYGSLGTLSAGGNV